MVDEIVVKQLELSETDTLLAFLRNAYADEPRKSDATFWRWHFLENPYVSPDDIPLWIAKDRDEIVGQMVASPIELKVRDHSIRAIWFQDFVVHKDYRGKGIGKRLAIAAGKRYPTMLTLGINEQSTAVFRRLKWMDLGGIHRYHKLLFPGNALKQISSLKPIQRVLDFVYSPFRPSLSELRSGNRFDVHEVKVFDSSFDELWERACGQWPCAVRRSSQFLTWQFIRQPGKKFEILGLYESDVLIGYIVTFFRRPESFGAPPKASIADLCYSGDSPHEVIDELIRAALRLTIERRTGGLVTDVLDPLVEQRLIRFGFWKIEKSPRFMAITSDHTEDLYRTNNWFLTRGDSDVSIFEDPNI